MKVIIDFLNRVTNFVLGFPIFKFFDNVKLFNQQVNNIEKLANNKELNEAVNLSTNILSYQSNSALEKKFRQWFLGKAIQELQQKVGLWKKTIRQADKLLENARQLESQNFHDPCDHGTLKSLNKALNLYKQASVLINHPLLISSIENLSTKITKYQKFQQLLNNAEFQANQYFFKQAVTNLQEAQNLFDVPVVAQKINDYQELAIKENEYEVFIQKSSKAAISGDFSKAVNLAQNALEIFHRSDGDILLQKLNKIIQFKALFNEGLALERNANYEQAKKSYQKALELKSEVGFELTEIDIRLAVICIKTFNYQEALYYLNEPNTKEATYLRGFVYAKQKQWQKAEREWKKINNSEVEQQRSVLRSLAKRERLLQIQYIESLVKNNNYKEAEKASLEFINTFGHDLLIDANLNNHIRPFYEKEQWKTQNPNSLINIMEEKWIKNQDITSLHNLALILYYSAYNDSTDNLQIVSKLISVWAMALANLELDPSIKNLVWLDSQLTNFDSILLKLTHLIENLLTNLKENYFNEYLKLKDQYRCDFTALKLIKNLPNQFDNSLIIIPGCYRYYAQLFPNLDFPANIWGALYTDWGLAVAACLDGDLARAIQLKPNKLPLSNAENFSVSFVAYHEGRYYLQQRSWQQSISPLQQAKEAIKANREWLEEIDQLCLSQRRQIEDFQEHLRFAQFWYSLLSTQDSKAYFTEYKAEDIREQLINKQITEEKALKELNQLKGIDPTNPILLDLIEKIEFSQEIAKIDRLFKQGQADEGIRIAKQSRNLRVRYTVAEMLVEILLKGAERRDMDPSTMYQFGKWVYELCPNEPEFQEIYRALRIPY